MQRSSFCFQFASFVLLFAAIAESQTTPELIVEISDPVPHVGDEVTFTCRVTGITSSTVTLNKVIVRPDQQFLSEQIAINDVLTRPYKDLARFMVTKTTDGETQLLVLSIKGVQIEDSGHYACAAPSVDNLYNMKSLEVYRKPGNVSFVHKGPLTTGSEIVITADVTVNLTCVAPDVLPTPSLQLWLERSAISPKDITENFLLASELNIRCPGNPLEKTCPMHMSYTVVATNRDFVPTFLHDGKQLTCTVKMKQLEQDEMSSTVRLAVMYPPKFLCAGLWNGTVNMTDLTIICQIYANPPSSAANKSVTIKTPGRIILVQPGEDTSEYSLDDTPLASTELKVTSFEFVIKTVTEEHFTYVYYLHAANREGNTTKEIRIAKSMTPILDGADSVTGTNIFAVVLSIVFALAVNQI